MCPYIHSTLIFECPYIHVLYVCSYMCDLIQTEHGAATPRAVLDAAETLKRHLHVRLNPKLNPTQNPELNPSSSARNRVPDVCAYAPNLTLTCALN